MPETLIRDLTLTVELRCRQVPTLSLVLLTHATISHLGAYAHCCKHFPLFSRIPVYATRPVIDLGRTLLQDLYASTPLAATKVSSTSLAEISYAYAQNASAESNFLLQAPTPEEIVRYFSLIQPLKYSQPHQPLPSPFSPPLNGLTITAYNSGHTLGGTIWHIQHGLESIVYAVDWNQARENVFAGAAWLSGGHGGGGGTEVIEQLRKPTALVCSSRTPEATLSRARRDEQLLESIKLCIARGGTVLIPVDSSARVLELAYLLEHAWRTETSNGTEAFRSSKLFLAGRNVGSTMRLARSMLEWMDDSIVREFEAVADMKNRANGGGDGGRGGPFDFKHLRLLDKKAQIERLLSLDGDGQEQRGKVILASDASLEWGFSKEVLKTIADDPKNLVVLTEKPSKSADKLSTARILWDWWKERKHGVATEQTASGDNFEQVYGGGRELEMADPQRQALEGNDLDVYQQWLATQRQLQATLQGGGSTALEAAPDVVDDASSESSEDSDDPDTEQQGKALNISTTMGQASRKKVVLKDEDLGVMILLKKKGVHDFDVRGKKGRERMFPVAIRRKRNDEYGELIRPEDYLRAEEREDGDGMEAPELGKGDSGDNLGKKRKWDDVGLSKGGAKPGPNKRQQTHRAGSADELDIREAQTDGPTGDELDNLEDEVETLLGPSKLTVTTTIVTLNLRIAFVDFSGLHDKRSLNMLIPLIQPRKLILVAGNEEETLGLAADCKKLLTARLGSASAEGEGSVVDVFTPSVGASINASVDTNAWIVKLADPLVKRLKWQNVSGLGIVTVTGVLLRDGQLSIADEQDEEDGGNKKRQKMLTDGDASAAPEESTSGALTATNVMPVLDVVPVNQSTTIRSAAQPLHVGDLRLADLRRAMQGSGHTAEFRGEGTLLIDGTVVVRKTTTGRVEVESIGLPELGANGSVGGTFYAVKRQIYEGLAVVAGA